MTRLIQIITAQDQATRDAALDAWARTASLDQLISECAALDDFRRSSPNLYERVRALFFLYAIHRFHIPTRLSAGAHGLVPFDGYNHLLARRFEEAIDVFLAHQKKDGPSDAISSALAGAYKELAFATLADNQVRRIRPHRVRGNQWMFRCRSSGRSSAAHPPGTPRAIQHRSLSRADGKNARPHGFIAQRLERYSFFLGMDFPRRMRGF